MQSKDLRYNRFRVEVAPTCCEISRCFFLNFRQMRFYKRLNWGGFVFMLIFTLLGALSRTQDTSLSDSIQLWVFLGLPCSMLFLFLGMEPNDDDE